MRQRLCPTPYHALALALLLTVSGCASEPAPETTSRPGVDNPDLGVSLASVPVGYKVVSNDAAGIHLQRTSPDAPGDVWIEAAPEQVAGVNLVAAVNDQKAAIEARPDGRFYGQTGLGSAPNAPASAFLTRGRYTDEGGSEVEEIRIFALHPMANRLLSVIYRFPPEGDTSQERAEQAIEIFGEVEAMTAMPQDEAGEAGEAGEATEDGTEDSGDDGEL